MEGLGVSACSSKGPHDFIHPRLKGGDCQRLFEIWQWRWILAHGLVVLFAAPFRAHGDLGSVEAAIKPCRNETRGAAYRPSVARVSNSTSSCCLAGSIENMLIRMTCSSRAFLE
jgi:hypothetical protein